VADSLKLVDWHISYSRQEGFGYSDAIGCPGFSAAAVPATAGPRIEDIRREDGTTGFAIVQDFRNDLWPQPCNYRYEQRYEFYSDGSWRTVAGNLGRGCGDDGIYRPILRVALAGDENTFASWSGSEWTAWDEEAWVFEPNTEATDEGFAFRVTDPSGAGTYVEPGRGQFGDGGRGDNAFVYVSRGGDDRDEGESDLVTLGSCCNTDHRQGAETFIEPPESIDGAPLVLWYVPQMQNDDDPGREYCWAQSDLEAGVYVQRVWPCYAGPMFVPVGPAEG
jgi:hypothetical protein